MLECRFIQAESAVNGGLMNETTIGKYHNKVYRQVYTRKTIDAKHQRAPFNSLCMCYMLDNKK